MGPPRRSRRGGGAPEWRAAGLRICTECYDHASHGRGSCPLLTDDMPHRKGQIGRYSLRLHVVDAVVRALLLLPPAGDRNVHAALLLYGITTRKANMAETYCASSGSWL